MARAGEPRVTVRFSSAEHALLEGLSREHGFEVGSIVKEAALRAARDVCREASAGRLKMRRRSASVLPVLASAATTFGRALGDRREDAVPELARARGAPAPDERADFFRAALARR